MTLEKCILTLAMRSKLCDNLISKELLVLSCLINEPGLRVSDIHAVLGGNKSWVSNLCSRLAITGLATSRKEGREVYYSHTQKGANVAVNAFGLIMSLVKMEDIPHHSSNNTYILYKSLNLEKKNEIKKIRYPIHTHKGTILYNLNEKCLLFIGKDLKHKLLVLEIPITDFRRVEQGFDDYYKRRKQPLPTPLIIRYETSIEKGLQSLYIFTNYRAMGRFTHNSEWFALLSNELDEIQKESENSNAIKMDNDMATMI